MLLLLFVMFALMFDGICVVMCGAIRGVVVGFVVMCVAIVGVIVVVSCWCYV